MRPPSVRFPFFVPLPCSCCGSPVEMTSPQVIKCTSCGAGAVKMGNEVERLKAVTSPEQSDLERAAARILRVGPYEGKHWNDLKGPERREMVDVVKTAIKTLKGD